MYTGSSAGSALADPPDSSLCILNRRDVNIPPSTPLWANTLRGSSCPLGVSTNPSFTTVRGTSTADVPFPLVMRLNEPEPSTTTSQQPFVNSDIPGGFQELSATPIAMACKLIVDSDLKLPLVLSWKPDSWINTGPNVFKFSTPLSSGGSESA